MKNQKLRATLAITLASAMTLGMAACGSSSTPANNGSSDTTPATESSDDGQDAPEETPSETGNAFVLNEDGSFISGGIKFPLEEKLTYTWWQTADATVLDVTGGDINNNAFFQEFERLTNIHFEFTNPAQGTEKETYGLAIASGTIPDIMSNPAYYSDGIDSGMDDGYFMDLTDLIPTYMPEYYQKMVELDALKGVKQDSGRIGTLGYIWEHLQAPVAGYIIRQDWLDDLGLDTPVTYDDWEVMLTRFKEEKGATAPLLINKFFLWGMGYGYGVFGSSTDVCYRDGDQVKLNLIDNEAQAKQYIETMHRWYENGLIDANFMSDTGIFPDTTLMTTDKAGVALGMYSMISTSLAPITQAGGKLTGVQVPVENAGDTLLSSPGAVYFNPASVGLTISADCENVEPLLAAFNYLFTEPGFLLANYGIEGQTYNMVDGEPVYTEEMMANIGQGIRKNTLPPSWSPALVEPDRQNCAMAPEALQAQENWRTANDAVLPVLALTAEENQELASITADLLTYIEETVLKYITGAESMDSWDNFISTCKSMNIERVRELKQAAFDRFLSR